MARLTGANLKAFFVDASGTIEVATIRSFTPNIGYDTAETSAAGDSMRNHALTLQTAEPSLMYIDFNGTEPGVDGTLAVVAGTALRTRLAPGVTGTLLWAEQGTATGKPKGGLQVYVTKNEPTLTYDGATERTVEFRAIFGTWEADPGTAVW